MPDYWCCNIFYINSIASTWLQYVTLKAPYLGALLVVVILEDKALGLGLSFAKSWLNYWVE